MKAVHASALSWRICEGRNLIYVKKFTNFAFLCTRPLNVVSKIIITMR